MSRSSLSNGGRSSASPAFDAIQHAVTAYLQAEQHAGRIPAGSDTGTIALALVGTTHHLLMTRSPGQATDAEATTRRLPAVLLA
ncbi:hypothetical protein [Streptomyces roseolilacinus]|uniref:hypothetical protein n=1 Tax=Streptomyces roseolilacinus TaxID=66904 RepID=UPI0016726FD1|nr:hypothetical protein [Streptomyces roseolilacinus]